MQNADTAEARTAEGRRNATIGRSSERLGTFDIVKYKERRLNSEFMKS
jgi:hypothetical protein